MDIGVHCNYCGRLDFLPFDCRKCGKVVCGEHRTNHDCIKETVLPIPESPPRPKTNNNTNINSNSQAKPKPKPPAKPPVKPQPSEQKIVPTSGGGVKLGSQKGAAKSERATAAFERLRMLVAGTGRSQAPSKQSQSQRAEKSAVSPVAPAELKKTAVGDQAIKFADRVYFRIERPPQPYKDPLTHTEGTRPAKTMPLFFSKSQTVGQVLDKAAPHLGYNAKGAGLKRMNGSVLDLSSPISNVPQGATLIVILS